MKQLILLSLLFISYPASLISQEKYSYDYGKITQNEMDMVEYELDKEAEAIAIYEKGEMFFKSRDYEKQFFLYQEKTAKIKILTADGLSYANLEIPLFKDGSDRESLESIEGTVYNYENGVLTKTPLKKNNIFDEKFSNNVVVKKIAFADVRKGSIIEYKYLVKSPFFFQTRTWNFQKEIPVVHSHLKYKAIPYFEYTYILRGTNGFTKYGSNAQYEDIKVADFTYREIYYDFEIDDIEAFRDENFISSKKDYLIAMDFQLSKVYSFKNDTKGKNIISTWAELSKDLLKDDNYGKYIKDSEKEASKILPTLNIETLSTLDKAKAITLYVQKMYTWNGNKGKYATDKLSNFLKTKKGNTADINLYLIGMLKAAGVEVNPIMLSTRDNGIIPTNHPFLKFFNYTIAEVTIGDTKYYIDATDPSLSFGQLPVACADVQALVIKQKNEEEWITLVASDEATTEKRIHITIDPKEQKSIINAHYITTGYDALYYKDIYIGSKNDGLKKNLEKRNDIEIRDSISNITKSGGSKEFEFSFNYNLPLEQTTDKIFLKPFGNLEVNKNPFTQKERSLPVDLIYRNNEKYTSIIEIPEGYEVEYLPKGQNHDGRIIHLEYKSVTEKNKIIITVNFYNQLNQYEAKGYNNLKNTFDILVKQLTDMVVLKKID